MGARPKTLRNVILLGQLGWGHDRLSTISESRDEWIEITTPNNRNFWVYILPDKLRGNFTRLNRYNEGMIDSTDNECLWHSWREWIQNIGGAVYNPKVYCHYIGPFNGVCIFTWTSTHWYGPPPVFQAYRHSFWRWEVYTTPLHFTSYVKVNKFNPMKAGQGALHVHTWEPGGGYNLWVTKSLTKELRVRRL